MTILRISSVLIVLLGTTPAFAQAPASSPPAVARAAQWVEKKPDVQRRIGLAEIQRAYGFKEGGIEELQKAAKILDGNDPQAAELQELVCWRMLPVAPAQREDFRRHVALLKTLEPDNPWVPVWELYLVTGEPNRAALLAQIAKTPAATPDRFPSFLAENSHLQLLKELGHPRVQAGVDVISARSYEPLHALRDLDRALTREADFLRESRREADAKRILVVRDRYRQAYGKASRHLIEKLFALHLAGEAKARDALLAKAKTLPYLHERQRLAALLQRLDAEEAWKLLIEPLLTSELAMIDNPPNLAQFQASTVAELQIKARKKTVKVNTVHYEGEVALRIHPLEVSCGQLILLQNDDPAAVILTGSDKVQLRGVTDYPGGIAADRFSYHAETGTFFLGGDIRLHGHDKTVKLHTCTLTQHGELRDPRSWLDDFRTRFTLDAKLDLLPKITKAYDDAELPDEVRYLLALSTLRPYLSWHAPYLPPQPDRGRLRQHEKVLEKVVAHDRDIGAAWQEALGGEAWMLTDIAPAIERDYRESLRAWYKKFNEGGRDAPAKFPEVPIPSKELYFWRIRDPQHPDIARAVRLLQGIRADELAGKARRWIAEIRRNNTVLTFDIAGAAPAGKAHSLLMDVRNAESVTFKLYRVQRPDELLHAAKNIGKDFLYRDHGLDGQLRDELDVMVKGYARGSRLMDSTLTKDVKPVWKKEQLVHQWDVRVADLKHFPSHHERRSSRRWLDDEWYDEADASYFDDECSMHRERIDKSYRPRHEEYSISSWQCDRIVQIPEKLLTDAGAYVLVAESNEQTAHVPIVVEPLSLTLRRCRDGVFALVSDAEGKKPLEGAKVLARGSHGGNAQAGEAITDKEGATFARILAYGDQPIIVHHQGRYAIGGFGQVFEGIYDAADNGRYHRAFERLKRLSRRDEKDVGAHRYADRHVVVAYTDRPTYRPGQDVQFKLIVRKLQLEMTGDPAVSSFRGEEFDAKTKMVLPDLSDVVSYAVLDPKGREVARGSLTLSEFGTAAGKVLLNAESVAGLYTFRVHIAGQPRIVPEVFAVNHYRRPNFEVNVTGVPQTLTKPEKLTLNVSGQYYFGPPVSKGTAEVRVLRKNFARAIVEERADLDEKGQAKIELRLPRTLDAGKYFVACSITDDSGRTASTTTFLTIEAPDASKGTSGLSALPRFIAVDRELKVATAAKEIRAQAPRSQTEFGNETDLRFPAQDGVAALKFAKPGWYRVKAGDDEASLFVYGGNDHPRDFASIDDAGNDRHPRVLSPKWVNLSDFAHEEHGHASRWEDPAQHLFALFDEQSVRIGAKLRLLVYVPHKRARLLFTIEGRTILDYAVLWSQENAGAYQIVEIPIKERHFPNVYLQGRILAQEAERIRPEVRKELMKERERYLDEDAEQDPRWCRIDVVKPAGKNDGAPLNVQIETDQANYRPGGAVRASIKVTDRDGRPQSAELSLAAVDESVFTFGEDNLDGLPSFFRMPYETRRFQPKVWRVSLGSRWSKNDRQVLIESQIRDLLKMAEARGSLSEAIHKMSDGFPDLGDQHFAAAPLPRLGGEMPAGQIPLGRLREHFHETAVWLPQLRTDEAGTARVSITLPDSLTRYRLTSVALTKTTEVGVGRARITAGLPLAVQVFLPRFAIEKDRLQAVAIVHNNTGQERDCQVAWQIEGAGVDVPSPTPQDWKLGNEQGKIIGTGRVTVRANSSVKVGVWLKLDRIGTARIVFRATDGTEADAEARTLPVQPLGRPAEVNANEELVAIPLPKQAEKVVLGKFNKEGRVQLPAGFLTTDLHISLAASDLAQALDGLDYLVDYPHGCIEQTMSRFLPAVMVKHATQHAPITLQPEIAAKLPDILQKGLTRVYGYQHADGSWGWFAKDSRNMAMSVYVIYGLARCQATGTKVDAQALRHGCEYLLEELRTNKLEPELAARAWYALALAGHAQTNELAAWARQALSHQPRPETCCNLALACRTAGLSELGEQLWAKARNWQPHDAETLALFLNTQLAYGAPYRDCRDSASRLLGARSGTRWHHTRDTSWAIEALSNMLGYIPETAAPRKIEVTLAGKTILEVKDAAELKKMIYRMRLSAEQLPLQEGLEIRMKSDSDEAIHVAVRAVGVQRLDEVKASGNRVKLQRYIETLEGEPVRGPIKIGQVVCVRLRLDLQQRENYLQIQERRPSLLEFADERIAGSAARSAVHQEFRDDRVCVFFASLSEGAHEIVYYLRAETPGQCSVLPGCAYPMYDEKTRGQTASTKVEVKGP